MATIEAAKFEIIEELVEDHFAFLARKTNVESYGVGDDARVIDLMVKIRLPMEHYGMDVDAIGRCIDHKLRALRASRPSTTYFHPFRAL